MQNHPPSDEDPARTGCPFPFFIDGYCRKHLSPSCTNCRTRYGMPSGPLRNQSWMTHLQWLRHYIPPGPVLGRRNNLQPDEVARPAPPLAPVAPPPSFGPGSVTSAQSNLLSAISRQPAAIGPQGASLGSQGLAHSSGTVNPQNLFLQRDSVGSLAQKDGGFLQPALQGSTVGESFSTIPSLTGASNDVPMTAPEQPGLLDQIGLPAFPAEMFDSQEPLPENQAPQVTVPPPPTSSFQGMTLVPPSRPGAGPASRPTDSWLLAPLTLNFVCRDDHPENRMNSEVPYFLPVRFCDVQIRVGRRVPISVRVPDIALLHFVDELVPAKDESEKANKRRVVRRVAGDAGGYYTKNNVPESLWRWQISRFVAEDSSGGLKLTFYDGSKGPLPPECPVQWPLPPPTDGMETMRRRANDLAGSSG